MRSSLLAAVLLAGIPTVVGAGRQELPQLPTTQAAEGSSGRSAEDGAEAEAEEARRDVRQSLASASDAELERMLDESLDNPTRKTDGYEMCLTEMVRRGGARWEKLIADRYAAELARAGKRRTEEQLELPLLTALCRIQGKDDPVAVLVSGSSDLEVTFSYLPKLNVNLTNLDVLKREIPVETGGDYRGCQRQNKWRVQLNDSAGKQVEFIDDPDMGGFVQTTRLRYHESIPASLRVGSYVAVTRPGTYVMTVYYHPTLEIATLPSIDGLICCRSVPIKLTVKPMELTITKDEQAGIESLIPTLPRDGPVRIIRGDWDRMLDFYPRNSPAGRIRSFGVKAVPSLIAAVNGTKLNPTQKAWALGLLFDLTGQHDPTAYDHQEVLGPFHYRYILPEIEGSGQITGQGSKDVYGGTIDPAAQAAFAKQWEPWIKEGFIKVKRED